MKTRVHLHGMKDIVEILESLTVKTTDIQKGGLGLARSIAQVAHFDLAVCGVSSTLVFCVVLRSGVGWGGVKSSKEPRLA
jgi:hypothetical protein